MSAYRPGRERRRAHRRRSESPYRERRAHGWGMGLYRNRRDGKVAGVAAGLADYWDVAAWVVRLMFFGAFLFTGTLALWAYVAGFFLLSPRPGDRSGRRRRRARDGHSVQDAAEAFGPEMEYDERVHEYRPRRLFRYSESASVRLARARERLDAAARRVEALESYVTSRRFKLKREFSRL